jgi:hypothetical protein
MVCQTKVTIEGRCHPLYSWRMEVDSYNVLFYTTNDEQMDQNIECIVLSIKRI